MTYHSCHELPFTQIHIVDTEFFGDDGDQKTPVCLVVRELLSGNVNRYWMDELRQMNQPPFDIGPDALFVAFFASAEFSVFWHWDGICQPTSLTVTPSSDVRPMVRPCHLGTVS